MRKTRKAPLLYSKGLTTAKNDISIFWEYQPYMLGVVASAVGVGLIIYSLFRKIHSFLNLIQ